jgi:integrase
MAKGLTVAAVERLKPDPSKRLEVPDGLLPGLYFVVQPSGARSWAVRYRHASKPRKLTLGPYPALDLGTARDRARDALQAVALGRDPGAEKQDARRAARDEQPDRDLFASVVETFLERHARAKTKERSAEQAEQILRKHVIPAWGDRRIQDITRRDVIELLDNIVDAGKPALANQTLVYIRKLYNWALDRSIVDMSPCIRIAPPAEKVSRDRVLSDEELRLVWKAAERTGWPFGPLVKLLILTAQRRDEVAGARRRELHEDGTLWSIPGTRTKNSQAQDVPLSEPAQAIIRNLPRIGRAEFLFTTTGETPVSGYSNAKERLDATMLAIAREEAEARGDNPDEVRIEPWRLHDHRRTAASGMARLGIPVHVIEAVLNHRSGQISGVAAVYNRHSYLPEKRRALEAWANFVLSIVEDRPASNVVALRG